MATKVRVSLTIDEALVAQAKAAGVNLSAVAEEAIRFRTREEEMRQWSEANREAIAVWNKRIEDEGLWSDGLLLF